MDTVFKDLKDLIEDVESILGDPLSKYEIIEIALKIQQNGYLQNISDRLTHINNALEDIETAIKIK